MPLPSQFAYDTETGRCPDGQIRTVLVQLCSVSAARIDEVRMIEGEDAIDRFFDLFEETGYDSDCHCYNLSYEISWIIPVIRDRYEWVEWGKAKRMRAGTFTVMEDPMACYAAKFCNSSGHILKMSDDMRRMGSVAMEVAADSVRKNFPEWFSGMERTKEETDLYNVWYTFPADDPRRLSFLQYARVDAWSQAMIARWLIQKGYDNSYTIASNGLKMALNIRYREKMDISDKKENRFAVMDFQRKYPPLDRVKQDITEASLLGGFVWGLVGTHKGMFYHYDYSSSYPKEYYSGELFSGKIYSIAIDSPNWERVMNAPNYFRWFLCDFDFKLRPTGVPAISGRECRSVDNQMNGAWNKKMREGHCSNKLITETYLDELMKNYEITDLKIWECWFAGRTKGDFAPFIEYCYNKKSQPELKGTAERLVWKTFMNGGIHGKTITKTHRKKVEYPDGERHIIKETTDPEYCALIGFSAMMNARERLIRHCRMITEAGYTIYMCDTDSMVTDCPPDLAKEILGDAAFEKEGGGIDNLGTFEIESFEGNEGFDEFRCWGLKRYLELDHGQYRKSAFAGMHDEIQKNALIWWRTDGTKYTWRQRGRVTGPFGKVVEMVYKTAGAENVWFEPSNVPYCPDRSGWERMCISIEKKQQKMLEEFGEDYMMSYFRDMMIYDQDEQIEDQIAYLEDVRFDEKDLGRTRNVKKRFIKQKMDERRYDRDYD